MKPAEEFQYAIEAYQVFPSRINELASHVIPWVELLLGVFLIAGYFRKKVASALSLLTSTFLFLLLSTKIRGIEIASCGCFGEGIHLTVTQALFVDSVLFCVLLVIAKTKETFFEFDYYFNKTYV